MNIATLETFIGRLGLVEEEGRIKQLLWNGEDRGIRSDVLEEGIHQLSGYFAGDRDRFDLPLSPAGTDFQQKVYNAMLEIPKGETRSYGDIAQDLGVAAQPVGQACGSNPIPVIIPCHRVVGSSGVGGFSGKGGVEMKVELLKFENAYSLLL